jgi:hypothetical protein
MSASNRLQVIQDLCRVVPTWISEKELAGKGKLIKVAQNVTSYQVK